MSVEQAPGVYVIVCAATGSRYVGSTSNCHRRWLCHLSRLRRGVHHSWLLQGQWDRHGEGAFAFKVVRYFSHGGRKLLIAAERAVMSKLRPDLNIVSEPDQCPTLGGFSQAHREKIALSHRRRAIRMWLAGEPFQGRPCPDQVKEQLSRERKGKRLRPLGYVHSEETKKKIGATNSRLRKGAPWSAARRAAYERGCRK